MFWIITTYAATITVGPTGDYATLSDAITAASPGDEILVAAGTFTDAGTIDKSLTVRGAGALTRLTATTSVVLAIDNNATVVLDSLLVDGEGSRRGVAVRSGSELLGNNLEIVNGSDVGNSGGACLRGATGATISLTNSTLTSCAGADYGGGIRMVAGSDLTLSNVVLDGCTAVLAGGGLAMDMAQATIADTQFLNNSAGAGGAIQAVGIGAIGITDSSFSGNQAAVGGAISVNQDLPITIVGTTFESNTATGDGGAIAGGGSITLLDRVRFEQNVADQGGAIAANSGVWAITNAYFCENSSPVGNQAISSATGVSSMDIDNALFVRNGAQSAGAPTLEADVMTSLRNITLYSDLSTTGVLGNTATLSVEDSIFTGFTHDAIAFSGGLAGPVQNNLFDGPSTGTGVVDVQQIFGSAGFVIDSLSCTTSFFGYSTEGIDGTVFSRLDADGTPADLGHFGGPAFDTDFWQADEDGDGWRKSVDCDDNDPTIHPGAVELCDAIDSDCDGLVEVPTEVYDDLDGDGFGDPSTEQILCQVPLDAILNGADCDDTDPAIQPLAAEACPDGIDNDCDGLIDQDDPDYTSMAILYALDNDSDGVGDGSTTVQACSGDEPPGYVPDLNGTDCDDNNPAVSPLLGEICDGLDNNCDSIVDEGFTAAPYWPDNDGDGFGFGTLPVLSCEVLPGHVSNGDDCDDTDPAFAPGVEELCDGLDNDCDGLLDDGLMVVPWYLDDDGDTFGDANNSTDSCDGPVGTVLDHSDCDDTNADVNPGATEIPDDGIDNDCVDGDFITPILDSDGDGIPDEIDPDPFSSGDGTGESPPPDYGCGCSSSSPLPIWLGLAATFFLRRRESA